MIAGVRVRLCAVALLLCSRLPAQTLESAQTAAHVGKIDVAVGFLRALPKSAQADELLCSLYASVEQLDAAVTACESASALAPSNSAYALGLARAYGEKASHSGSFAAMRMVGKIRGNFERAVQLDPNNTEAISDLGQFYVEAPGIVGGGVDKARPLVSRLQALSPARSHRLTAMIAVKTKDNALASQEFQAALAVSHSPESYVDLANFYRGAKELDQAVANARLAIEHDPRHGPDTLDAAALLIDLKRELPAAEAAIRSYLGSPQPNVASYAKAHVLLGRSLSAGGKMVAAQAEYKAALALAHDYEPARQGLAR